MQKFVDEAMVDLEGVVDLGVVRNLGNSLNYKPTHFVEIKQISDARTANTLISGNTWANIIGSIQGGIQSQIKINRNMIIKELDDTIDKNRDKIYNLMPSEFIFKGLDNTEAGFSPSYPRMTFNSICLIYVREKILKGMKCISGPYYAEDLFHCLHQGHLPCGWDGLFPEGKLCVY